MNRPSTNNGASSSSGPSRSNSNTGSGITQAQLSEALGLALGGAFQGMTSGSGSGSGAGNAPASTQNFDAQLSTMRDMGIVDEGLARRALEIMGGDVQAAVDLIFSGWNGSE